MRRLQGWGVRGCECAGLRVCGRMMIRPYELRGGGVPVCGCASVLMYGRVLIPRYIVIFNVVYRAVAQANAIRPTGIDEAIP